MSKRPYNPPPARRPSQAADPSGASFRGSAAPAGTGGQTSTGDKTGGHQGPLSVLREWADALVIAFVLAMFIRIFLVELFKIPSGSMTPTLIGGEIANVDFNHDGLKDLLYYQSPYEQPLLFINKGQGNYEAQGPVTLPPELLGEVRHTLHQRDDRILVNKLAYWFHQPRRGDIVVFKVPPAIWAADKPIYIKRTVGEPGDHLAFDPEGHLLANGQLVTNPDFFKTQRYITRPRGLNEALSPPEMTFDPSGAIARIDVPEDKIYVFGDNTNSSLDSRYWGGVPLNNVKGRAFFRYYPLDQMHFFRGGPRHNS